MEDEKALPDVDKLAAEAKQEINEAVDRFIASIKDNTVDPDHFMTIDKLESNWSKLNDETRKIFVDLVSRTISSIDEGALIERKKGHTAPKV